MKWAYGIRRKISAALLLAAIFVLVFVKNLVDSRNVTELGTSFSSVYEDRLLVESYIYRLSEHLFRKKIMIDTCSSVASAEKIKPVIARYNEAIGNILAAYEQTRLTEAEGVYFDHFKTNVGQLIALEDAYFLSVSRGQEAESEKERINKHFNYASSNLDSLSGIQVSEGKLLNDHSQKIVAGSSLLTQFEIGILIAIALMIMVLVFESSAVLTEPTQKESLN